MSYTTATTDEQIEHLQHSVNECRIGSKTIRVDVAALRNLLLDHHAMADKLTKRDTR